jgi:hypothetical protein
MRLRTATLLASALVAVAPLLAGIPVASATGPAPVPSAPPTTTPAVPFVPVAAAPPAPVPAGCTDPVVAVLAGAGFTGTDLREAWAIAMRESGGVAAIGPGDPRFNGHDYGLFQLNQPTWGTQAWWDPALMATGPYNAAVAFQISQGGRDWLPWGLDGTGRPSPSLYRDFGWTRAQIRAWVVRPYRQYFRGYPC